MTKILLPTLICLLFTSHLSAQNKYKELECKNEICIAYNWTVDEMGETILMVRFKNKAKISQQLHMELGIYETGILKETVVIEDCIKKTGLGNALQKRHLINSEFFAAIENADDKLEVKVIDFSLEKVESCE